MAAAKEALTFEVAADKVTKLKTRPNSDVLLKLYAHYKQATTGDCNTAQPYMIQVEARSKWDAWNALKGITKDDAKAKYIALATDVIANDK